MTVDNAMLAMQKMASASNLVREYAGSDSASAMLALLDALIDSYKLDLMHVKPDGLERLQAAINQCQALRNVAANQTNDIPKI